MGTVVFWKYTSAGASIPLWDHDAVSALFQISPLFPKKFQTLSKIFKILPSPKKFLDFHPPKFLMTFFLVIVPKFRISPYFPCFSTFPSCFAKIIIPPYFDKFPPVLDKFTCFYILYVYFVSPLLSPWCIYASHNARTGRPCTSVWE